MTSTVTKNVFESLAAAIHDLPLQPLYDLHSSARLPQDEDEAVARERVYRRAKDKQRAEVALAAAAALTPANERFDPVRFVRQCGVTSGTLSDTGIAAHSTVLRLRINALSRSGR